jgi:hypothetical protein
VIFTLEALQAAHGDALLLHYGPADSAKLAVIDAGPAGIYRSSVRSRLEEIRACRAPDATLTLDYLLVSHIDDVLAVALHPPTKRARVVKPVEARVEVEQPPVVVPPPPQA